MAYVEKRGENRYRVRYRGPGAAERSQTFTGEKAHDRAKAFATEVEHSKIVGAYVDPGRGRMTVNAWGEQWMSGRVHLKPKTVAGYESLWRSRIAPQWSNVPLGRLTNADIASWLASMRRDGLSASRVRQAYHLFSSMLDAAVLDRRLASNPASGIKLPRLPKVERRYLDHDQVARLARAAGDYELLVLVLAYCGLRYGEAAALRVRRVDPMRRRLDIAEAMTTISGRAVFGTPKTHQTRSVPFPGFMHDAIVEHIAGRGPDAFVFAAPRGGVLRDSDFRRKWFDAACVAVGLGEMVDGPNGHQRYVGFTPHALRHTAASIAIASGASVKGVQAMLGHASAAMTLDLYGHLFGDELDAVAEHIDRAAPRAPNLLAAPAISRILAASRGLDAA